LAAIWIVSDESTLPATLAHHVEALGEVWIGAPERAAFKSAPPPDLLILCGVADRLAGRDALERLLAFVSQVPQHRRAPAPALFIASDPDRSDDANLGQLFDDRKSAQLCFPFDPEELLARTRDLLGATDLPPSLRERARRGWVTREVERLYAGIDLPALRQAVDPRNAHRPVLLLGEPGTRRDLLARYVHILAEPPRDSLVSIALAGIGSGELERAIMTRTAGERVTVYLGAIDRASPSTQDELANLLGASGALAVEPLRWIASAVRAAAPSRALRELPWLRVELPALRARPDKRALIEACFKAAAARQGRELALDVAALELLHEYGWPGNLRELEQVAEATCATASGSRIGAADVVIAGRTRRDSPEPVVAPEPEPVLSPELAPAAEPEPEPEPEPQPPLEPLAHEPSPSSDEDLMLATLEASDELPAEELEELEPLIEAEREEPKPAKAATSLRELLLPLAQTIRGPLRAVRTYAGLVEQRPDDAEVRRELCALVDRDLGALDDTLQRVERFARLGVPVPRPLDLAAVLGDELDARQAQARAKSLVVLRELDTQAPPVLGDKNQLRLAAGALLDMALRLVPHGGDLYLGSAWRPNPSGRGGGHRILLRFHSPEDVLTGPIGEGDGDLLEVVMARELITRAGGTFAVDASGAQDNVILVELPG